jgi:hypothetical protein
MTNFKAWGGHGRYSTEACHHVARTIHQEINADSKPAATQQTVHR